MLFSTEFGIASRSSDDDWFDTILNTDTRLFVDLFLIFKEPSDSPWATAHGRIVAHFDLCFQLIVQGNLNPASVPFKKALDLLSFPEPAELCLGFTSTGIRGSGSGRGYANLIASAMVDAVTRGVKELTHFEELGILNEGIGADRISDITCNVLKRDLIAYTQSICKKHNLPTRPCNVWAAGYDDRRLRWTSDEVELPWNVYTGNPVILVPKRFLRELPSINDRDWWSWYENERLREDFNYEVMGSVNKATIVETARQHPAYIDRWLSLREEAPATPYNFESDPHGVVNWDPATANYVNTRPLTLHLPDSDESFFEVIETVLNEFQRFVEECRGWSLLWNDNQSEKPEEAAQLLFRGIVEHYCRANNIVVDREVELGRGPVDFKFSNGYSHRALLEIKKLHNGKFWNGLDAQLLSYMRSDACADGWFVAIGYRKTTTSDAKITELPRRIQQLRAAHPTLRLRSRYVDAMPKSSASKL